jgi:hypothetical protein
MGDRLSDGAGRGKFQRMRRQWLANCAAKKVPCWYCGGELRYELPHGDPLAVVLCHIQPVKTHPELEYDTANWAPACALGNRLSGPCGLDGDDPSIPDTGVESEDWNVTLLNEQP